MYDLTRFISHYISVSEILITTTVWGRREDQVFHYFKRASRSLQLTMIRGYNLSKILNVLPLVIQSVVKTM